MSAAFTIGYRDHQSHGVYEELRKAYNERRAALGHAARYWDAANNQWADGNTAVATGDKIQHHNFFREIQQWIVDNCGYFLRPDVSSYSGVSYIKNMSELANVVGGYPSAFEYLCKEVIGGNLVGTSDDFGFREWDDSTGTLIRSDLSVEGSGHARGKVIAKAIGENLWCVTDDICDCLSALRATKITGTGTGGAIVPKTNSGMERYGEDFLGLDDPGAWANYDDATEYNCGTVYPQATAWTTVYSNNHSRFNRTCTIDYYDIPAGFPALLHSAVLYYKTKKNTQAGSYWDTGWGEGYHHYESHGTGCVEGKYGAVASLGFSGSGSEELNTSGKILGRTGSQFTLSPTVPYWGNRIYGFQAYGEAGVSDFIGVALWNFTNGSSWT